MGTKSREVIWGGRIVGAGMRAKGAREEANKAIREGDRRMSRAPDCVERNAGFRLTPTALDLQPADLEVGSVVQMPVVPTRPIRSAGSNDKANRDAPYRA
jgi:hypothetical protein